jgi:prepilin-type N-terminal cleavage/methylation domain-containing protein
MRKMHKGFSLIELLIVIVIISVVYFLGFSGLEKSEKTSKALTPLNLKSTILSSIEPQDKATLLCVNDCETCYIKSSLKGSFEAYENKINLDNIEAYTLDAEESLSRLDYGRFHDKKICLIYHFYKNGSASQLILKNSEGVYFLPAFFGKATEIDSLEDAKDLWLKNSNLVSNHGEFY